MRTFRALSVLALALPFLARAATPDGATPTAPPPSPSASPSDADLLKELEAAATPTPAPAPAAGAGEATAGGGGGGLSISNKFNPAMSVNGLFLGRYSSREHPTDPEAVTTGMGVQELEIQFITNVDPYFAANLMLSMDKGQGIAVEEGFVQPTWQPYGMSFRIGQLKVPFGRENWQHTHAYPFIDKSLIGTAVFGPEGLNEFGVEGSWLSPLPWYSLVYASYLDGKNDVEFNGTRGSDFVGFGAWKNLFDLSDDTTLELQGSYAAGQNDESQLTQVGGAHAMLKWKPARHSTTRSVIAVLEGLYAHHPHVPGATIRSTNLGGGYGYVQVQLAKRWFTAARAEYVGQPLEPISGITRKASGIVVFVPTEFSAIRAQFSAIEPPLGADRYYEGLLQMNFTLGAHPAHAY